MRNYTAMATISVPSTQAFSRSRRCIIGNLLLVLSTKSICKAKTQVTCAPNWLGPLFIIGLGDYQGGGLYVDDQGGLDVKEQVRPPAAFD
jgi:hypothetical protein